MGRPLTLAGVLTKPDRLVKHGRESELTKILSGQSFAVGFGYWVVKRPSHHRIGVTHTEAQREEQEFFDQEEPWNGSLAEYRNRFGTANLTHALAELLAQQTRRALPSIRQEIDHQLREVESELAKIPKPPTRDVQGKVREVVRAFAGQVEKELLGEHPCNEWKLRWRELRDGFADDLKELWPLLSSKANRDEGIYKRYRGVQTGTVVVISDSDEEKEPAPEMAPSPSKKRKIESQKPQPGPKKSQFKGFHFSLDETKKSLDEMAPPKNPNQVNPNAISCLMLRTLQKWKEAMENFLDNFQAQIVEFIAKVFDDSFSAWRESLLAKESRRLVHQLLKESLDEQKMTFAVETLQDELEGPYFYDLHEFDIYKREAMEQFRKRRFSARVKRYFEEMSQETQREYSDNDRQSQLKKDALLRQYLEKEPYERELDVVAQVSAYYRMASKRFHDSICMRIESTMFRRLRKDLNEELVSQLAIAGADGAFRLLISAHVGLI